MALCEMCGKYSRLTLADVEGVDLKLCNVCVKFGIVKRYGKPITNSNHQKLNNHNREEPQFRLVANFSNLIKSSRESKNMDREEFSQFLNEKESLVAKWEQGHLRPRIGIARKLGKLLGHNFVEKDTKGEYKKESNSKNDEMTLGDFIKIKKRK
jgi:putative transcription factor